MTENTTEDILGRDLVLKEKYDALERKLAAAEAQAQAMRQTFRNLQGPYGSWFNPDFHCLACKHKEDEPHADDCAWVNAVERKSDTAALDAALEQAQIEVLDVIAQHRFEDIRGSQKLQDALEAVSIEWSIALEQARAEERERCARKAMATFNPKQPEDADYDWGYNDAKRDIAHAIRQTGTEATPRGRATVTGRELMGR